MDFGYFGLMGYRERGTPPRRVFEEHVEQVRQADAVGARRSRGSRSTTSRTTASARHPSSWPRTAPRSPNG